MVISVSVQCNNGGSLPDIMVLTLCDSTFRDPNYKSHVYFCSIQPMFPIIIDVFITFPPADGVDAQKV